MADPQKCVKVDVNGSEERQPVGFWPAKTKFVYIWFFLQRICPRHWVHM